MSNKARSNKLNKLAPRGYADMAKQHGGKQRPVTRPDDRQSEAMVVSLLSRQPSKSPAPKSPIVEVVGCPADYKAQSALPGTGFVAAMRETPFYRHPFVGCKVLNVTLASNAVSWSGLSYNIMANIAQGVADNQRTGDIIRVLGGDLRVRVSDGSAGSIISSSEYQLKVVYSPLQTLVVGQVFQDTGTAFSGLTAADWDYSPAVKILSHAFDFVDQYHPMKIHDLSFRCNLLTNYDAGSSTVATGSMYLMAISGENPAAPTETPSSYGMLQLYYQDV